jgi:hypothetical protein
MPISDVVNGIIFLAIFFVLARKLAGLSAFPKRKQKPAKGALSGSSNEPITFVGNTLSRRKREDYDS